MLAFEDLLAAFEWVSSDSTGESSAYVSRSTGKIYWDTDALEIEDDFPEDLEDDTQYLAVPHKHDLDLGKALVFEFVHEHIQDEHERVSAFFRKPGAYGKFKDLLEQRQLLDGWYEYEQGKIKSALLQWASDNSIPLSPSAGESVA